jgi:flagellar biosynthetic protein FliQ
VEAQFVALGVQTLKLALMLSLPMLLGGLIAGLAISIFQATTQINEMTLSFIPKIIIVALIMIITMPWMMNEMIDFTIRIFDMIKSYAF